MFLVCPLCGKLAHLSRFNPDEYDDDIQVVEMKGLGRGKGFEVTSRFSALGDEELMDLISSRCHAILKIVGEDPAASATALERELGEWKREALGRRRLEGELRAEVAALEKAADENEEHADSLVSQINVALSEEYEDFDDLDEAVSSLIREYNEALEEVSDEDDF